MDFRAPAPCLTSTETGPRGPLNFPRVTSSYKFMSCTYSKLGCFASKAERNSSSTRKAGPAKIPQRRMEVDGVHGHNGRDAAFKAAFRQLHIFFQRKTALERLDVDRAMQVQHLPFVHIGEAKRRRCRSAPPGCRTATMPAECHRSHDIQGRTPRTEPCRENFSNSRAASAIRLV